MKKQILLLSGLCLVLGLSGCGSKEDDIYKGLLQEPTSTPYVNEPNIETPRQDEGIEVQYNNIKFTVHIEGFGYNVEQSMPDFTNGIYTNTVKVDLDTDNDGFFDMLVNADTARFSTISSVAEYDLEDFMGLTPCLTDMGELSVQGIIPNISVTLKKVNGEFWLKNYSLVDVDSGEQIGTTIEEVESYYNLLSSSGGSGKFIFVKEIIDGEEYYEGTKDPDMSNPIFGVFQDANGREVTMYLSLNDRQLLSLKSGQEYDVTYFPEKVYIEVGFKATAVLPVN